MTSSTKLNQTLIGNCNWINQINWNQSTDYLTTTLTDYPVKTIQRLSKVPDYWTLVIEHGLWFFVSIEWLEIFHFINLFQMLVFNINNCNIINKNIPFLFTGWSWVFTTEWKWKTTSSKLWQVFLRNNYFGCLFLIMLLKNCFIV